MNPNEERQKVKKFSRFFFTSNYVCTSTTSIMLQHIHANAGNRFWVLEWFQIKIESMKPLTAYEHKRKLRNCWLEDGIRKCLERTRCFLSPKRHGNVFKNECLKHKHNFFCKISSKKTDQLWWCTAPKTSSQRMTHNVASCLFSNNTRAKKNASWRQ